MSANILVVDDEAAVRNMLSEWLRGEGYQCDLAGAADEALDLVERRPPLDVALLDLAMPGEDGVWLAKRLRERQQDVAVIMCTGWQSFDAAVEGMRIGVNDYLLKPFSRLELLEAVQRAIRWRTEARRA
ncbi:MAG: response regulator, partial [Vicinamibacterales bacterium]